MTASSAGGARIYYGWYIVAGAFVANFVMGAGLIGYIPGVFLEPMSEELGWSRTEFIAAFTTGQFVAGATGVAIGSVIDRHGGRSLMLTGTVIVVVSLLLTAEVRELWQWILIRGFLQPIGLGMAGPLVVHVVVSKWFVSHRGRAIGIAAVGLSLAGVVFPNVLTPIVDEFGWRAGWRALAILALLLVLPAALLMRRQPEDYGLRPDGRRGETATAEADAERWDYETSLTRGEALRTPVTWLLVAAFGLVGFGLIALATQAIPLMTDAGFSRAESAALLSLLALPGLLTRPFWGLAAERIEPRRVALVAFLAIAVGELTVLGAARSGSTTLAVTGFLTAGVGMAGYVPLQELMWATFFGRRHLGAVRSAVMPARLLFGASGPVVFTAYYDVAGSYDGILLAVAMASAAAAGLVMLARAPARRSLAPAPPPGH